MTKENKKRKKRKRNQYGMNIKKSEKKNTKYYEDMESNKTAD